jgi:NAD(P)-dependent dehydrogenase (short-subunit alcohol dehydrogenase family)
MTGTLAGRVAVVTGAGRGVGRAIAEAFAAAGADVAVNARSAAQLQETADKIASLSVRAVAIAGDVTQESEVAHMVREVMENLGPIDVLVNNAGRCSALGPVWEVDPDEWWRDVEVNLRGTFLCTRAVLQGMLERGSGRIINVSSYAAIRPDPYRSSYASAKLAVLRFTESLAIETRGRGVCVFAITPGTVRSAMTDRLAAAAATHDWPVDWASNASGSWLPPERAGELAVFLASGRADALTGRFIHVLDDVADLVRRAEEIRNEDLYTVRLRRAGGTSP